MRDRKVTQMLRKLALSTTAALALSTGAALAAGEGHVEDYAFSFEGPFGSYDQNQLQRGLQIFTDICSSCHGVSLVAFRTLADEGGPALPEDQMRAYAEQFYIPEEELNRVNYYDADKDEYRVPTPADYFPHNSGAAAPDLSLMAKARAGFHGPYGTGLAQLFRGMGGAEYITSILTGYAENPDCAPDGIDGYYYNTAFSNGGYPETCVTEDGEHMVPGSWIAMSPPLMGDDVEFIDGHSTEIHHEAQDVAAFLMWAAEPHLNARKQAGLTGVIFLTILATLLYLTNKRLWAPHKHRAKQ